MFPRKPTGGQIEGIQLEVILDSKRTFWKGNVTPNKGVDSQRNTSLGRLISANLQSGGRGGDEGAATTWDIPRGGIHESITGGKNQLENFHAAETRLYILTPRYTVRPHFPAALAVWWDLMTGFQPTARRQPRGSRHLPS